MKNLTIVTLDQPDITDFSAARNRFLREAKTDWVLFLDSDEKLSPALEKEIQQAVSHKPYAADAYFIPRLDTFLGKELRHGETGNAKFIRLGRNNFGNWIHPVHEVWSPVRARRDAPAGSSAKIGSLKNPMLHTPHTTISSFLTKINKYSSLDAKYRFEQGKYSSLFHIAIYPYAKFFQNYILRLGFLDGVPGMIMAIMMSFHSYLTWTKLYLLWHKK